MTSRIKPGALSGKVALVTGSSRGIGAATVVRLAAAGADVVVNYRDKARRAERVVLEASQHGGRAIAVQADLTRPEEVRSMFTSIAEVFGGLDVLVMNASGGMEAGVDEGYAMRLNRDAQVALLDAALTILRNGARVVFVTSHQAHFIESTPTMPEYEPVARSKRAGEDAIRERIPELRARGIEVVVVSGDMIEGTITATLLERANPGAIESRREASGRLYDVDEFATEVAEAVVAPVPADHTILLGSTSSFETPSSKRQPPLGGSGDATGR